jgi:hypothetical protein
MKSATVATGDGPGNWGEGRMAQQAPADIEHDFAGDLSSKHANRHHDGDCRACVWFCAVYGRKPSKNQKDHREQLLANHKPVEKMAGRRMVRHRPMS